MLDLASGVGGSGGLDETNPTPLYLQLQRVIQDAVRAGKLKADEALPSERDLARQLGISRVTVRKAIAGLVDYLGGRLIPGLEPAWPYVLGNIVALLLAILNMMVHTHDGWTSVVPWGLTLSALVVVILLFTCWIGWSPIYRHDVGVVR